MYDIEVKVSLKPGMLNPEATTIQRSLALLGYEVKGTKTKDTYSLKGFTGAYKAITAKCK